MINNTVHLHHLHHQQHQHHRHDNKVVTAKSGSDVRNTHKSNHAHTFTHTLRHIHTHSLTALCNWHDIQKAVEKYS